MSPLVGVKVKVEDHLLIKAKLVSMCWSQGALIDFHLLESSSREEEEEVCVDQGSVRIDQHSSSSEVMSKSAFPILVYGGASCESSPSEDMPKSAFPILVYGGASCESSPSKAQSDRKSVV